MQGGANSKLQPLQTPNADANPKMLISLQGFGMWDGIHEVQKEEK